MKTLFRSIAAAMMSLAAVSAFGQDMVARKLEPGWNMVGNSYGGQMDVLNTFGNYQGNFIPGVTDKVTSIWKWGACVSQWQFYSPLINPSTMASTATGRGATVLSTIYAGDGFWVFAKDQMFLMQADYPADWVLDNWNMGGLCPGWNLLASPVSGTPSEISAMLTSSAPPSPSDKNPNSSVISLWMLDPVSGKWYFYSPSLEQCGPDCLYNYTVQRGFLDFNVAGKTIEKGDSFWVNYNPTPGYYGGKGISSSTTTTTTTGNTVGN